ncbi:MAG TPA: MerR family transcriptional regulator [Armatimonadaceae bacterium]|nr:MerR family transcriptional regulator [Armatimonadaceae bacterium]
MPDPRDEPVYVISVAARLAGLPSWVLRVLDQEEIVVPVRTDSNRRLYSDNDIALLSHVRQLTEERGVNIAGVKVILEMERDFDRERAQAREREWDLRRQWDEAEPTGRTLAALPAFQSGAGSPPHAKDKA